MAKPQQSDEFDDEDLAAVDPGEFTEADLATLTSQDAQAPDATPAAMPEAPPPPARDPGFFSTVGHNLLSGFFKQGHDEAAGALGSGFTDLLPGARYKMPDGTTRPLNSSGDLYRAVRDTERETLRGGTEHRPWTSFASSLAGDLASDAVLKSFGVPVESTAYQVASGALSGFLGSDAELTGPDATARDYVSAGASTGLGAGLGYVMPKVGAAFSKHVTPAISSRLRKWLEDLAISKGRRVLLNGADALAGNKELAAEAVRETLESGAMPPFSTTQGVYKNLEELAEMRGENYAEILRRLQEAGVEGPKVQELAEYFEREGAEKWRNSTADKSIADIFSKEADNVRAVAPPEPTSFEIIAEGPMAVTGPRLGPEPRLPPVAAPAPGTPPPVLMAKPEPKFPPVSSGVDVPVPTKASRPPIGPTRDPRGRYLPKGEPGAPRPIPAVTTPSPLPEAMPPIIPAPEMLPQPVVGPLAKYLPLDQAEEIKRYAQNSARWDRLRLTGLDEAKQQVSSAYRKAIEDAIAKAGDEAPLGSEVAHLADEFLPVKQQLARTIAARDAAERGTAAAAKRRGISLTDYLSAAAAASGGPAGQLLAAAGNNFARNRGTSALAAGAYGLAGMFGRMVRPDNAEALGSALGAAFGRRATIGNGDKPEAADMAAYREAVLSNPEVLGVYSKRLADAASQGPEAFAVEDYLLSQTAPEYADMRRRAMQQANGEQPQ